MSKLIDLHIHSSYSDGDYSPEKLIEIAKNRHVKTISITDHDTVLAYHNLEPQDIVKIIPGIELSSRDDIGKMHILGYGIDPFNKELLKVTNLLREKNIDALLMMIDYLKSQGLHFNDKDISCLINKVGDVGRMPLARLLVDYGYSENTFEAFDKYLYDACKYAQSKNNTLLPETCIELIKNAGGIPILAHPVSLKREDRDLEKVVKQLINLGLEGIEVFHSVHSLKQIKLYLDLVKKYNLLYSCGTDYHGNLSKPDIEMGTGIQKNLLLTNCSVVDSLKNRK